MDLTEQHLCERIRQGNKEAFEQVFKSYYRYLVTYAHSISGDMILSEEIVQELFFQLWMKREGFHITHTLKAYLFRAVRNSCMNHFKHQKVRETYADHVKLRKESSMSQPSHTLEMCELQDRLAAAIDMLPPERKKIFLMIRMEERKYKEVAEMMGISLKTVENQMGKAMQFLRQALRDYLPVFLMIYAALGSFLSTTIGVSTYWIVII